MNSGKFVTGTRLGRVESFFVPTGVQQWGRYDRDTGTVEIGEGDGRPGVVDLLDLAAAQAFLTKGSVYAVSPEEIPGKGALAAVFRY